MLPNESQLIAQVQSGQTAMFGVLYDHYIEPIYRFVYGKTHHRQTAEDLTSAIFIKAMEGVKSYKPSKGTFTAWLYRVARNTIIDHYRRQKLTLPIEDAFDLPAKENTAQSSEERLFREQLDVWMIGLTAHERDVVTLRIWQGLHHRDIAAIIDTNEVNCKKIYSRAIAKMRKNYQKIPSQHAYVS
ncbi:MAG: RNA polymerase sigma factor [Patescibacteria group bacterium]